MENEPNSSLAINRLIAEIVNSRESFNVGDYAARPQVFHFSALKKNDTVTPHTHRSYEVATVVTGNVRYYAGEANVIEPGQVFIAPPGVRHGWKALEDSVVCCAALFVSCPGNATRARMRALNESIAARGYALHSNSDYARAIDRIERETRNREIGWEESVALIIRQFYIAIFRHLLPGATQRVSRQRGLPPQHGDKVKSIVELARFYIQDNITLLAGAREVSDFVGISQVHLNRLFNAEYGKPVSRYITDYKINTSRRLLENTDRPLKDIASSVGYDDIQYFCRVFKKQTGKTPSEFRRKRR